MATIDASAVNVALPSLTKDLGTTLGHVQWVANSYLLVLTAALLVFGRLSDVLGRRGVYVWGLAIFAGASVGCAFSDGVWTLVTWRAVQGLGASMATAVGPALVVDAFPVERRARALGTLSTVVGGGLMVGPGLGGLILSVASWRWIFLINVPIGIVAIAVSLWAIRPKVRGELPQFDWLGSIAGTTAVVGLLSSLSLGPEVGWVSVQTIGLALFGFAAVAAFVLIELRAEHPVLDVRMFRFSRIREGVIACLLSFMVAFLAVYLVPFYLEDILSTGPLMMGLTVTSLPVCLLITAPLAGWVTDRWGASIVGPAGMSLMVLALGGMAYAGGHASAPVMSVCLGLIGASMGLFQSPNNSEVLGAVPTDNRGSVSATLAVARHLGTVLGIAGASTLFQVKYKELAGVTYTALEGKAPNAEAFDAAFRLPLVVGVITAAVAVIVAWLGMRPKATAATTSVSRPQP